MIHDQLVPALLAALMGEGVQVDQIESAVTAVGRVQLGQSITALAQRPGEEVLVRSFIFYQASRLEGL